MFILFLVILCCGFANVEAWYNINAKEYEGPSKGIVAATYTPGICRIGKITADPVLDGVIGYGIGFVDCTFETNAIYDQWEVIYPKVLTGKNGKFLNMQVNMTPFIKNSLFVINQTAAKFDSLKQKNPAGYVKSKYETEHKKLRDEYQKLFDEQFDLYKRRFHEEFSSYTKKEEKNTGMSDDFEKETVSEEELSDDLNNGFDFDLSELGLDLGHDINSLTRLKLVK